MVKKVFEIIENAGGSIKLAYELNVHQYTIERWKRFGIPPKYWSFLQKKYGVTASELLNMNEKIRADKL